MQIIRRRVSVSVSARQQLPRISCISKVYPLQISQHFPTSFSTATTGRLPGGRGHGRLDGRILPGTRMSFPTITLQSAGRYTRLHTRLPGGQQERLQYRSAGRPHHQSLQVVRGAQWLQARACSRSLQRAILTVRLLFRLNRLLVRSPLYK